MFCVVCSLHARGDNNQYIFLPAPLRNLAQLVEGVCRSWTNFDAVLCYETIAGMAVAQQDIALTLQQTCFYRKEPPVLAPSHKSLSWRDSVLDLEQ